MESNAASSGKVTLSVNNAGMKFQFPSQSKLYVVSAAKQDSGQAGLHRLEGLYFYQTKARPYAGELQFF